MGKPSLLSKLAFWATLFALIVVLLGAFTRLIDAGLGCPDWPGCYGQLTVPLSHYAQQAAGSLYPDTPFVSYKAWAEMVHRYFVSGLSFFILTIVTLIFSKKAWRTKSNLFFAGILILLLVYQIILGQWTVTLKLLPIIVTQHLLGGFLIVATLWSIHLNNKVLMINNIDNKNKVLVPLFAVALVLVLLQILLGAWTSTNYASLSCADFPFCDNTSNSAWHFKEAFNVWAPIGVNYEGGVLPLEIRQTIQMTHRVGALVLTIYLFGLMGYALPKIKESISLMKSLYIIICFLLIQVCLGISNVVFKLPLTTALSHTLIAVLLMLALLSFIFKLMAIETKEKSL